jgi:hypothetical protein
MAVMYCSTPTHDGFEKEMRAALAYRVAVSPHGSLRDCLQSIVHWVVERAMRTRVIGDARLDSFATP